MKGRKYMNHVILCSFNDTIQSFQSISKGINWVVQNWFSIHNWESSSLSESKSRHDTTQHDDKLFLSPLVPYTLIKGILWSGKQTSSLFIHKTNQDKPVMSDQLMHVMREGFSLNEMNASPIEEGQTSKPPRFRMKEHGTMLTVPPFSSESRWQLSGVWDCCPREKLKKWGWHFSSSPRKWSRGVVCVLCVNAFHPEGEDSLERLTR